MDYIFSRGRCSQCAKVGNAKALEAKDQEIEETDDCYFEEGCRYFILSGSQIESRRAGYGNVFLLYLWQRGALYDVSSYAFCTSRR